MSDVSFVFVVYKVHGVHRPWINHNKNFVHLPFLQKLRHFIIKKKYREDNNKTIAIEFTKYLVVFFISKFFI